ncbi:MAG: leucine-rich repeat domain-containing protein [Ruminococcaceae bacterium]|nr:leucine-rich repeat domain-containing protein [Oscillospiraceae bacterium]
MYLLDEYDFETVIVSDENLAFKMVDNALYSKDGTTLYKYYFNMKSEERFEIPAGVKTIGSAAFKNATALKNVVIPGTVETIGNNAFEGSGLTSIVIPEGVTTIGQSAFYICAALESVSFPNTLKNIGAYAFMGCQILDNVIVPASVEVIGDWGLTGSVTPIRCYATSKPEGWHEDWCGNHEAIWGYTGN